MRTRTLGRLTTAFVASLVLGSPSVVQAGRISDFYSSTHIAARPLGTLRLVAPHSYTTQSMATYRNVLALPRPPRIPALGRNPAPRDAFEGQRGTISCVPFARITSGIDVKGNAGAWWGNAAGLYSRGNRPENGSVLSFRATDRMPLGHVAVVAAVVGPRLIKIDHANWAGSRGTIARGVAVMDVSPNNDWTEVRLGLAQDGVFGSVYPTYGFIYDRSAVAPAPGEQRGAKTIAAAYRVRQPW